jgi:hypothetical protein
MLCRFTAEQSAHHSAHVQQSRKRAFERCRVVAKLVRRLHVDDAIMQLSLLNKCKAARAILKVQSLHPTGNGRHSCLTRLALPAVLTGLGGYEHKQQL